VHVIKRRLRSRVLLRPSAPAVVCMKHRPVCADDPAGEFLGEIEVDQFGSYGDELPAPRSAAVVGEEHEAVDDLIASADRPDDPTGLLIAEADAVKFRRAAEIARRKSVRFDPDAPAIVCTEN